MLFLSVVILGRFTTETHAMALLRQDRHAATTYTNLLNASRESGSAAMIPEVVTGRGSSYTCRLEADFGVACRPVTAALAWSG